jgi:hypothetical protein
VKFFTPKLLAEYRSSDRDVAETAAVGWQERAESYRKRLQEIRHRLPHGVRQLLRTITLHDACLLTSNLAEVRRRPQLFLSFQLPDSDGQAGVQLRYDLVKPLRVELHQPKNAHDPFLFALYDEFDILPNGTLTHSILLSGGVELCVQFTHLAVIPFTKVIAPVPGQSDIKEQLAALMAS